MDSMQKFFRMLERAPRLKSYWCAQTARMHGEELERCLGLMSRGESALARFFVGVWRHDFGEYGFDLGDAAIRLEPEWRQIIIDWLADPFWP